MRIAYFDCFSGAAGDMIVGACLDAGASWQPLLSQLSSLGLDDAFLLRHEKVNKKGVSATAFHVDLQNHQPHHHGHDHSHRNLPEIQRIINRSTLSNTLKQKALCIFDNLARAEAKVHGIEVDQVHFHEVGAVDAIVDIVGSCIAMELLEIEAVYCSPLVVGGGTVQCEHGLLPVPAPATAELIRSAPIAPCDVQMELLTPTGAAVLTTLSKQFGPLPAMRIDRIGYGAGRRECTDRPNVLRVMIGQLDEDADQTGNDPVWVLQANLDDCSGELIGHVCESLMAAGALDAFTTAIMMKKNRPGVQISAICHDDHRRQLETLLFQQTTTFGIRRCRWDRTILDRQSDTVETPYGPIGIKIGRLNGRTVGWSVEFEHCRRAAQEHNVPVKDVLAAAQQAHQNRQHSNNKGS